MSDDLPKLCPGAVIAGADLSNADFDECDLSEAVLTDCTFDDAQFSTAMLEGARFVTCRFLRCRFAHADLRDTLFDQCNFADPDSHSGVEIAFSRLDQAVFKACDLSFADLSRTSAYDVRFETCNLRGARFHKVDFSRAFGRKVVRAAAAFTGCNLELADLSDAVLPSCNLAGSSLREADLSEANLEGADLSRTDLFQALTGGANLTNADLRGAHVSGLNLAGLGGYDGMKVALDQQQALLTAMGLDVYAA
jgi:fluoroquinolone resistance protein